MVAQKKVKIKKKNIKLASGILHVNSTWNNTHIILADMQWNKISWGGTGLKWFKWAKENTPYAAEVLAKDILNEAKNAFTLKEIGIVCKGVWLGREGVFKALNEVWGIDILYIQEKTPIQLWWCKWTRPKRN
jgi:small subunit ribosomal protein S11